MQPRLDRFRRRQRVANFARGDRESHVRPAEPARRAAVRRGAHPLRVEPFILREREEVFEVGELGDGARGAHRLTPTDQHAGRPLLFRVTPSLPRATAPLSVTAEHARTPLLSSAAGPAPAESVQAPPLTGLPHAGVPYFFISQTYDTGVADALLAKHGIACPPFRDYVGNLLDFVEEFPRL